MLIFVYSGQILPAAIAAGEKLELLFVRCVLAIFFTNLGAVL